MGAVTTLALRPGDVIAERYEVERVLGVGGMGAVVAARDRWDGESVAIKALLIEQAAQGDVVARFARECRATARLRSEHVARVFGTGTLPTGVPYMVMELLVGQDLKSLVKAVGPLPFKEAAAYACQACVALTEAHALGIVHRDLKPANLFLAARDGGVPMIKVLDFGIARFSSPNLAGDALEMTQPRAVLGSRAYMAPEQMRSPHDVDARADVWGLGAILYYLVTGRAPFTADTAEAVMMRVAHAAPPPIADVRPDAPAGFERVVLRCLAKAREDRWANVAEVARALSPFTRDDALAEDRATVPLPRSALPSAPSTSGLALTTSGTEAVRPSVARSAPTKAVAHAPPAAAKHRLYSLAWLALVSMGIAWAVMTALLRFEGAVLSVKVAPEAAIPCAAPANAATPATSTPPTMSSAAPRHLRRPRAKPPMVTRIP